MTRRLTRSLALGLLCVGVLAHAGASAAELFNLDRDPFTREYLGPVGPLVLSGEIVPGDYAHLLARLAENPERFFAKNELILASTEGDAAEAMRIAKLLRSLYTQVVVGPLTGRCAGACFLIYVAATQRATDGENLLGVSRPGLSGSEWAATETARAALLEEGLQARARAFLTENEVPQELIEAIFARPPTDIAWLTEQQERALGTRSPAFARFLKDKCGWDEGVEHAVYRGERPVEDLRTLTACRARVTEPEARKAFARALKDAAQSSTTRGK